MTPLNTKLTKLFLLRHWLAVLGFLTWGAAQTSFAQGNAQTNAFAAGARLFNDHFYSNAEKAFADFATTYTNSPLRSRAILFQARSRLNQTNITGAIELLQQEKPAQEDPVAPEYQFWMGEAFFKKGEYQAAANSYADLNKNFPKTVFRLNAADNEAAAYARLRNWTKVVELLGATNGDFQLAAREDAKNPLALQGWLLLGQALFEKKQYAEGQRIVSAIPTDTISPSDKWRRLYLLSRLQLAGGQSNEAIGNWTNLIAAASSFQEKVDSHFLHGEIFEKLEKWDDAIQAYTNNLAKDLPVDVQKNALARTMELRLQHNQTGDAIQLLETFVAQSPNDPSLDRVRLTLGELYLKAAANAGTNTTNNFLALSASNLDLVIQTIPRSEWQGRAYLDRGWCAWLEGKKSVAKTNFLQAAQLLPESEDQAVARFKLADAQFYEGDYAGAATNYNLIWHQYGQRNDLKNGLLKNLALFAQALFQSEQASLARGDQQAAIEAMSHILEWYPDSYFGDRSMLVAGEASGQQGELEKARETFNALLKKYPRTPLAPEVQYAIARTYALAADWPKAVAIYAQWATNYAKHPLLPQVEYARALATWKSGAETNALALFTQFVTRFPNNTNLAALAQYWIGDYYFRHDDFQQSDIAYQEVFGKYPNEGELPYQAHLMAGRAAVARQGPNDYARARVYFTALVRDTNTPPAIMAESFFALGDTIFKQFQGDTNNPDYSLQQAVTALSKITNGAPTNTLAAPALGRIGDFYFQWADMLKLPPSDYNNAIQAYEAVLKLPGVDVTTSSQALVGLGLVAERQGRKADALNYYATVLEVKRPCDPFWVNQAGVYAARLREDAGEWNEAILIYRRVAEVVPSLDAAMKTRIDKATAKASKPPEAAAPVKSAP